jgi:hypothetical protein
MSFFTRAATMTTISAATRTRIGASGLFGLVVLLALTGCGSSGPAATSTRADQTKSSAATSAGTGRPTESGASPSATTGTQSAAVPEPAHTVVVVMENHSYADIIGNPTAPFINTLAARGALFTRSYAVTHPSEPNYLALFSGSTQGIADDGCPYRFSAPNLAADLMATARASPATPRTCPARARRPAHSASTHASTSRGRISATCQGRSACPSPASPRPISRGCRRCPS